MNITEIATLRKKLHAARALDSQDPMNTETPHLDAAIAEMGEAQFHILLACEDAIRAAGLTPGLSGPLVREIACRICSQRPAWLIHHMAEAIFSAAGFSDSQAWDAGHLSIHIELERHDAGVFGQQIVAMAR